MSADPSAPASIRFDRVRYQISPQKQIIAELTLAISAGETVVLLGRSGSGKTTTLKLINRLLEPSSGQVSVQGKSTLDWDPIRLRRHVGYVIQEIGLFPHFTVAENVAIVPALEGWGAERTESRVQEMLELVGLDPVEFAPRYPDELSGGQRQRVGVARALAADPSILLLDEPFGALDPITRAEIRTEFRNLQSRLNKTMVFVTHDVRESFLLGDRVGLIADGRLIACVPPGEFERLEAPEARQFMESLT